MADDRIEGIGTLQASFAALAQDMPKNAARRVVLAGANVLKKGARQIVQSQGMRKSGALLKNIVVKRESRAPAGTEEFHLGVRHGRALGRKYKALTLNKRGRVVTRYLDDPFYWWFVERGHRITRRGPRRGQVTGQVKGHPFIEASLEKNDRAAIEAMEQQALKEVERMSKE